MICSGHANSTPDFTCLTLQYKSHDHERMEQTALDHEVYGYLFLQVLKGGQQLLLLPSKISVGATLLAQPFHTLSDVSQHPLHTSNLDTAIKDPC